MPSLTIFVRNASIAPQIQTAQGARNVRSVRTENRRDVAFVGSMRLRKNVSKDAAEGAGFAGVRMAPDLKVAKREKMKKM